MIYTYRKAILTMLAILIIIGGGIGVYSYTHQTTKKTVITDQNTKKPTIQGINSVPLSTNMKDAVTRYATETLSALYGKGTYKIVVRDNSYQRSVSPEGNITVTILLDAPEQKSTYLYTQVNSGTDPESGTSYLRCAPDDQQIVKPSVCKDVAND